jgi:glycine C-acetyltransferase
VTLAGFPGRTFLRCNTNGYLGLATHPVVRAAAERAAAAFGVGPQAVRFIAGTYQPHVALEGRLASFHGREAAMIFSSAYATMLGVLPALVSPRTAVVSDELNHNCIITAARLAQPVARLVYRHADLSDLAARLGEATAVADRVVVVTDGVFSMRGDHAPLAGIDALARAFHDRCAEGVVTVVDDSHGIGALGATGRGAEEVTGARADVLVATLGKALGANGGYVCGPQVVVDLLRETSPLSTFSNPIGPADAAAAHAALDLLDGGEGQVLLGRLRRRTSRFRAGLVAAGFETIGGDHPVVPLLTRDAAWNRALVAHLFEHGVLVTGLGHPVVPAGEEELRFQLTAEHTDADVDEVLAALRAAPGRAQR